MNRQESRPRNDPTKKPTRRIRPHKKDKPKKAKRRPTKFTATRRAKFLLSLGRGASIESAAAAVGVNKSTIYETKKEDTEFAAAVDQARLTAVKVIEGALWRKARSGNTTAQIFYLCNRRPEDWKHVNRIELTGKDGGPIRYDDAIRRIDERRAELLGGASVVRGTTGGNGGTV